jgi:hypothetical protein
VALESAHEVAGDAVVRVVKQNSHKKCRFAGRRIVCVLLDRGAQPGELGKGQRAKSQMEACM